MDRFLVIASLEAFYVETGFPVELLDVLTTVEDLFGFVQVKALRRSSRANTGEIE